MHLYLYLHLHIAFAPSTASISTCLDSLGCWLLGQGRTSEALRGVWHLPVEAWAGACGGFGVSKVGPRTLYPNRKESDAAALARCLRTRKQCDF